MDEKPFAGIKTFLKQPIYTPDKDDGGIGIVGVPFDLGTSNRPGARFGPDAIRRASAMLCEEDDPHYKLNPVEILDIWDCGDIDTTVDISQCIGEIELDIHTWGLEFDQLVTLGGDHTITLPILRALHAKHGPVRLVHFDAHCDTWVGDGNYGHGSPFYYAINEGLIIPEESTQIGIRSAINSEHHKFAEDAGMQIFTARDVHEMGPSEIAHRTITTKKGHWTPRPTYLTFDIDSIDPSQAPGTGTPEVGGIFTWQALAILDDINTSLDWVGMDVVEVAPAYDVSEITSLTAATIIWHYLCILSQRKLEDKENG